MVKRDFMAMTDAMTDVGYPVDSLLSLARLDASFAVCHNLWDFSARVLATHFARRHQAI